MRKLVTLLGVASPALLFAEGSTPAYETAISSTQTALESAISSMAPAALAIIAAGIGVWLIPKVVRVIKRAFSAAA